MPEQLQLGGGGGLCFASQSRHATLGPPMMDRGVPSPGREKKKERFPYASFSSLHSSANRSSTKTYFSSFPLLVRGRNSPAEKWGLSLSFINSPTVAYVPLNLSNKLQGHEALAFQGQERGYGIVLLLLIFWAKHIRQWSFSNIPDPNHTDMHRGMRVSGPPKSLSYSNEGSGVSHCRW